MLACQLVVTALDLYQPPKSVKENNMKKEPLVLFGVIALLVVGYFEYYKKATSKTPVVRGPMGGNFQGYTSMMKLPPNYYNATSMGNYAPVVAAYSPGNPLDTWSLGSNGGDGAQINGGWQAMPDSYSSEVSNAWLQCEAQGAHL